MTGHEIVEFGEPIHEFASSLGEAPLYRPEDDSLHYVCPLSDPPEIHILPDVTRFNSDSSQARVLKLSDSISVALFVEYKRGYYFGAGSLDVVSINEETGEIRVLKELLPASVKGQLRFNDGAVDCKGRFWFGELDFATLGGQLTESYIPKGRLWRYDPDGTASIHDNEIAGSNGIAWSPDNKFMYHNDSVICTVRRYEFDPEAGTLSNRIDFLDFRSAGEDTPDTAKRLPDYLRGGQPDGMVTDTEGNLWIAIWKKSCVLCVSPDGALLREIRAKDTPHLTCPGWGGKNFDVLYCTSAAMPGDSRKGGCIFKLNVGELWGTKGAEKRKFSIGV